MAFPLLLLIDTLWSCSCRSVAGMHVQYLGSDEKKARTARSTGEIFTSYIHACTTAQRSCPMVGSLGVEPTPPRPVAWSKRSCPGDFVLRPLYTVAEDLPSHDALGLGVVVPCNPSGICLSPGGQREDVIHPRTCFDKRPAGAVRLDGGVLE